MTKQYAKTRHAICALCGFQGKSGVSLKAHIQKSHKLATKEYTIKHLLGGIQPTCAICSNEPRYVAFTFKPYCKEHSHVAEALGGARGGQAPAWNRGKTAVDDPRIAAAADKLIGPNNPFFGRHHTEETKKRMADSKRLPFDVVLGRIHGSHPEVSVLSDASDYDTNNSPLSIVCRTCGTSQVSSYWELTQRWMCRTCNPTGSRQQLEVADYIRGILGCDRTSDRVLISTRSIITPEELDVWVPEKQLAVEYHGLFWHSGGKDDIVHPNDHRNKYLICLEKGIRLIQLFGDEWRDKQDICRSIIANALGLNATRLNGRDCVVRRVDASVTRPFLEKNHLSGPALASNHYALVHADGTIVGVITLRRPNNRSSRYASMLEVARMAFPVGTTVRGGASKLLKAAAADVKGNCGGLLSYADLRFGVGDVYARSGFRRLDDTTTINYWYTDGTTRFDRSKVTAIEGLTEAAVARSRGLRQIHGCGNAVYIMDRQTLEACSGDVEETVKLIREALPARTIVVDLDGHACRECGYACINKRSVGMHTNKRHAMTLEMYVLKHFYGGVLPKCRCGCGRDVMWHRTQNCFNLFINGHNAHTSASI